MKAIGDKSDPMEISELLGNKTCFVCTNDWTDEFIVCSNCNRCAHSTCVRNPNSNWCRNNCHPMEDAEEEEDAEEPEEDAEEPEKEALSGEIYKDTVPPLSPHGLFRSLRPHGKGILVKSTKSESVGLEDGVIVAVSDRTIFTKFSAGQNIAFYSDAGRKMVLNKQLYILLEEDDVLGFFLIGEDVKYLIPEDDRLLIKVVDVEDQIARGLLLTDPSLTMGTVVDVGGSGDVADIKCKSNVLFSKSSSGHEIRSPDDGRHYTVVRKSDVIGLLSVDQFD